MNRLSDYLNSDWARLNKLSKSDPNPRRFRHAFSPRFAPVVLARIAQRFYAMGYRRLSKVPALINFVIFGIEIPPRLLIGPGLVLMHTQGTVLGAATIGSNVTIYQQVTLGARDVNFAYDPALRPTVSDGVQISAGAKVLGGLTLGEGCIVGANAVVLADVPSYYVAVGVPAKSLPPKEVRERAIIERGK